jgi:hypothetical protein
MVIGYLKVILARDAKRYQFYVHTLVLNAFAGQGPNGYVCNHKDGDKHNNRIENLEWVTRGNNIRHAHDILGVSMRWRAKLTPEQVKEIRKRYSMGNVSQSILAREYSLTPGGISRIITGDRWKDV